MLWSSSRHIGWTPRATDVDAADPTDPILEQYRALTADDALRFDVHWLGPSGCPGRIEPLYETDRLWTRPLRMLRGFLHRLDAGFNAPTRAEAGQGTVRHVKRPGYGLLTVITSVAGSSGRTGWLNELPWIPSVRRARDGWVRRAPLDRICAAWGLASNGSPFWKGSSGPHAWLRPDGRFILADTDGWGSPVLLDAIWRQHEQKL